MSNLNIRELDPPTNRHQFDAEYEKIRYVNDPLSKFPSKGKIYRLKAKNNDLFRETELKEVTNTIIYNLCKSFQLKYRTTFTAQINEILTYTSKESKQSIVKSSIKDIKKQGCKTAVER